MARMSHSRLAQILRSEENKAVGYHTSEVAAIQEQALDYYYGREFGDEVTGRSRVVSQDVAEIVDTILPDLVEMFAADHNVVRFRGRNPQSAKLADQATKATHHIFWNENKGFFALHDLFKDGLMQIVGIAKITWEDDETVEHYSLERLSLTQLMQISENPNIDITESEAVPFMPQDMLMMGAYPEGVYYNISVKERKQTGKVCVDIVPPEEFLVQQRTTDINSGFENVNYIGHKREGVTYTELLYMGFDEDQIKNLPSDGHGEEDLDARKAARHEDESLYEDQHESLDRTMWEYTLIEEYTIVDYDGDGMAEPIRTYRIGDEILDVQPCDDHPFASFCPYKMPHKLYGQSAYDKVHTMQRIKSVLWRQMLDAKYIANNPRYAVDDRGNRINIDDLLDTRVGSIVRTEGNPAEIIMPLQVADQSSGSLEMMELAEDEKMKRSGVSRFDPSLNKNMFHDTATGMSLVMNKMQGRIRLMGRVAAEGAVRRLFELLLKTLVQFQQSPRMMELGEEWLQVDPTAWGTDYDVQVTVGLGYESREQKLVNSTEIITRMSEAIQLGMTFIQPENMRQALLDHVRLLGAEEPERYIGEVPPPQPAPEDPLVKLAEMELQLKAQQAQVDAQLEQMKMMLGIQKDAAQLQQRTQETQGKAQLEKAKLALEAEKFLLEAGRPEDIGGENVVFLPVSGLDTSTISPGGV